MAPIKSGRPLKVLHLFKIAIKHKLFDYPNLAIIETTNTCNLNCPTCTTPRHILGRPPRIMTMEEFKKNIDQIKNYTHIAFLYNTNEPLMSPHLAEMIKYCDKQNMYTLISTNAALLDEEKTNEILNAGLDEILLCLDGMSKESYNPFRLGADFEAVKNNIKYFCSEKHKRGLARPYLELQFILTKLNQHEVGLIREFAKEIGADRLRIKSCAIGEYAYSKEKQKELSEKFLPTLDEYKNKVLYEKKEDGEIVMKRNRGSKWECKLAKTQLCILADNRLAVCCYDIKGQYICGDLNSQTMKEIVKSDRYKKIRKMAKEGKLPLCDICGEY